MRGGEVETKVCGPLMPTAFDQPVVPSPPRALLSGLGEICSPKHPSANTTL